MGRVPSGPPTVSRRHVLIGTVALALIGAAAAACGAPPPKPDVDALVSQLDRARADSEMAATAATIAPPAIAAALNTVAAQRTSHARALTDEITRVSGATPAASTSSTIPTTTTSTSAGPVKPPSAQDVIAALKASSDSAAQTAAQRSGYQAGLLGSIAASCAAASAVGLDGRQTP
jgi:hypothetical protein